MAISYKIYNLPKLPVSGQLFSVPGAAFDGGYTSGGSNINSPEPGGRSKLNLQLSLQVNEWDTPYMSWLMSKINGEIFRIPLTKTPQLVTDAALGIDHLKNGVPWAGIDADGLDIGGTYTTVNFGTGVATKFGVVVPTAEVVVVGPPNTTFFAQYTNSWVWRNASNAIILQVNNVVGNYVVNSSTGIPAGAETITSIRTANNPELPWDNNFNWDADGVGISSIGTALEGSTVINVRMEGLGPILKPGHVIGFKETPYLIDEISYNSSNTGATIVVKPPLRKDMVLNDFITLRPTMLGRISNGSEIQEMYDSEFVGHIEPGRIVFSEVII